LPVFVPIEGASGREAKEKEASVAMIEHEEMKSLVLGLVRERFDSAVADGLTVDMVNLDRGGRGGLVYLGGAIVRRGAEILDGYHRLKAASLAGFSRQMRVVEIDEDDRDPIPDAIYVQEGPTPDYLVDRPCICGENQLFPSRPHQCWGAREKVDWRCGVVCGV
jgi:hypothetical protein